MDTFNLPMDLVPENDNVHIVAYQSSANVVKNKITMHSNLFSFLLEGVKTTFYADKSAQIDPSQFVLLSCGNCIMSEKNAPENGIYRSVLLFFDNKILSDFFIRYPGLPQVHLEQGAAIPEQAFITFHLDPFLRNFLHSLELMLAGGRPISRAMRVLKFEELMLYMVDKYPQQVLSLRTANREEYDFRQAVEAHIENNITIDELAFLCNMSTSTFKRRFAKVYGIAPSKWYLQKRMEMAATLLLNNREKPSDVYHKVGYENHSSFSQSFKQVFGLTPSEYQQQKMTAWQ
ncbi:helix-turn-helix domain-containing protein [Chitinophaga sancti]|uniref:AraC family transcriptional regulator n=1 Tax=Chitinophaga sancti TaxID=1004 RepID=A0A1K1RBD8_9BACT|nr:AraC family transcriptional regulator [Chitinophaga sancti]WQD65577.1 AraC family transcriptional regulator [Chitinophaga sancti]WQG88800.1 AraC family transcriptional regulator [Chitinophaga sancti]SFW69392.1 AraC-type DNA-binding protein [Chitinophaga sancti]